MKEREKLRKWEFLKGAAWIAAGGFIAKLIGALYRIPLTNLLGGRGMGLYQMVYPVYCLLLTVSATGIPSSIAKLTAERIGRGESAEPLYKTALKLFLWIGGVGTLLMCAVAPFLSAAQGSKEVVGGYYTLAPSVFLVSAISVLRGWFQGRNKMYPTALSEIVEQLVKVGFGLFFAYRFRGNVAKAVVFLLLAVSLSEIVSLCVLLLLRKREKGGICEGNEGGRVAMKRILRLSIPVTFSGILLPCSALLDSVLVPRFLGGYADGIALYGLFSGGALTVMNLPVSICYGVAAASVPAVATATAKGEGVRRKIFFALFVTLLLSALGGAALYFFAKPAAQIIFRSLKGEELPLLVGLIKRLALSTVTLSCAQTLSACLTAQGKPQCAALSMLIAVAVKTVGYSFWLKNPQIGVYGLARATNLCYLVAFFLNLVYNLMVSKRKKE